MSKGRSDALKITQQRYHRKVVEDHRREGWKQVNLWLSPQEAAMLEAQRKDSSLQATVHAVLQYTLC
jgi:hypothetical protein